MGILSLFSKGKIEAAALHRALVAVSRRDSFYIKWQVPDTLDGRYEVLALHAALLLARLRGQDDRLAQLLFDEIFTGLDLNLREMGVGDLGVGKRVRKMAEGLYGRMTAYEGALIADDDEALYKAFANNLYGTLPEAPARGAVQPVIDYYRAAVAHLRVQPLSDLQSGHVSFPDV